MKIGYIGLGLMGNPCVKNLLKNNFEVHIWARNKASMEGLIKDGAKASSSIKELADQVDILITNVSDTSDVEEVLLGSGGVIESDNSDLIIIDMSTISAIATREMSKKLKEKGMTLVDAPVSGGTAGAEAGTLTIMVGADKEVFEKIKPTLKAMGKSITLIGSCGAGQVAKSCNQIIITGTIAAVAEAFKFAEATEVDFEPIREALLGGFAASKILDMHGMRMIKDDYTPGFKTVLHKKDMGIVKKIGSDLNLNLPITDYGLELLDKTIADGDGEVDSSAMCRVIKKS